jgi:Ca-activated chloride channel family protein
MTLRHPWRTIEGASKMSNKLSLNIKTTLLIVFAGLFMVACSPSAEALNQEGNEAFAEQAYLDALQLYQSAQIESPGLAEPYYNAANALYRQGDYPAAFEQIQKALEYIDEESLAESSFYNLGNTLFNSQELGTAVEAYTQALMLDPSDLDAKYNLELALQQQQQQEQEDQQQQEGENESQEQDESSESESQPNEDQGENQEESQNGADQEEQNPERESENSDESDGEQESSEGTPQDSDDQQDGDRSDQIPPPGQRMTEEQAKQLLAAIANDMQTLQEKLGQYLFDRSAPPVQDW